LELILSKNSSKGIGSVFESHLKELNASFREAPNEAGWFLVTKEAAKAWLESRGSTKSIERMCCVDFNALSYSKLCRRCPYIVLSSSDNESEILLYQRKEGDLERINNL
jgi:hypothetical protein